MNFPDSIRQIKERFDTVEIEQGNNFRKRVHLDIAIQDLLQLILGGLLVAFGVAGFIAPNNIAPGGSSGIAIILNNFVGIPIGILMLIFNIPAFFLGYKNLGGSSFLVRSLIGTLVYNLSVDGIATLIPSTGFTDEMILNAVFGGIIVGAGGGLIYRAGGVAGAGGVINRLLRNKIGWPMRTTTLLTNGLVVIAAGFVFGWEAAMFAVITFFVSGSVSDFILEGPDVVQTALIITDNPARIGKAITDQMSRGITRWEVEGNMTGKSHTALYCTVTRPEVTRLKNIVAGIDNQAFVIISQGHEAIGRGFKAHNWRPAVVEDVE